MGDQVFFICNDCQCDTFECREVFIMIKSCKKCTTPCCVTGPGPYAYVSPEEYIENFSLIEGYNTRCSALTETGKCSLWGTKHLPQECRVYICQTRSFSKDELKVINNVFERTCPKCECVWMLGSQHEGLYVDKCEVCGFERIWDETVVYEGNE